MYVGFNEKSYRGWGMAHQVSMALGTASTHIKNWVWKHTPEPPITSILERGGG